MRWPDGVTCPHCHGTNVKRHGRDERQRDRQRYVCSTCHRYFDDLTDTIFESRHQTLRAWILCLYFMGLNLSNRQIAQELSLNESDVQQMTQQLREGVVNRSPTPTLEGEIECDEVYVVAGHKGKPDSVKKKGAKDGVTV